MDEKERRQILDEQARLAQLRAQQSQDRRRTGGQGAIELAQVANSLKERLQARSPRPAVAPGKVEVNPTPAREPYEGICRAGYDCPICGGSGYYREDLPIYDPGFGKLKQCPNVDITKKPGFHKLGLHPQEVDFTWDKIMVIGDGAAEVAAQNTREVIERGWGWVYLHGNHGTAKSLILKIAVAMALKANVGAAYANMAGILQFMRAAYDARNPNHEAEGRLEWLAGLPILAIDEFDLIQGTEWEQNQRFQLMDERYNRAILGEGVTLIASNRTPEQLSSWYADRILDGRFTVEALYGKSARPGMEPWVRG